jgi:hypothetical protein
MYFATPLKLAFVVCGLLLRRVALSDVRTFARRPSTPFKHCPVIPAVACRSVEAALANETNTAELLGFASLSPTYRLPRLAKGLAHSSADDPWQVLAQSGDVALEHAHVCLEPPNVGLQLLNIAPDVVELLICLLLKAEQIAVYVPELVRQEAEAALKLANASFQVANLSLDIHAAGSNRLDQR